MLKQTEQVKTILPSEINLEKKLLSWKKQKEIVNKYLCKDKKTQKILLDIKRYQVEA